MRIKLQEFGGQTRCEYSDLRTCAPTSFGNKALQHAEFMVLPLLEGLISLVEIV